MENILSAVGKDIALGLPLGLGKANSVLNALYTRAAADPSIRLRIFSALTLARPAGASELERRFLDPLFRRLAGDYPELAYNAPLQRGTLPENITVHEFYVPAGRRLHVPLAQQAYTSTNYTHAVRDLLDNGINVIAQLVAHRREQDADRLSLSCNPESDPGSAARTEASTPRRTSHCDCRSGERAASVHAGSGGRRRIRI